MKNLLWILPLLLGLVVLGCESSAPVYSNPESNQPVTAGGFDSGDARPVALMDADDAHHDDGDEEEIPLDEVPANVKQAAMDAVPGLVLEEAEKETENGIVVYSLEGTANGKEYEVEVSAAGKVLEIEEDDDDDDDDHDDDHDDDGDHDDDDDG